MKLIKNIVLAIGGLAVIACDPISEDIKLSNSFNLEDVELKVIQSQAGGNNLTLQMNTPGVCGYWDYIVDKKFTNEVNVIFPFTGTHVFTYKITTPYMDPNGDVESAKFVSKTIEVNITEMTDSLPQPYYYLVGSKLEGKSWVFYKNNPWNASGGPVWWAMADPANWQTIWWNAGGTGVPPSDPDAVMTFNLNGGANYLYQKDSESAQVDGTSFKFNADYSKLTVFGNANIPGQSDPADIDVIEYEIKKLTADELILFVPNLPSRGTGWVWTFKPAAAKSNTL